MYMLVRELMRKDVTVIPIGTSWREVAALFLRFGISGAPVVDGDKVVGVVSEKDLFRAFYPSYREWYATPDAYLDFDEIENNSHTVADLPVEKFMSTRLITVKPDTHVLHVGSLMIGSGIHRVPVIENGKLVGMVGRREIFRAILREQFGLSRVKEDRDA